MTSVLRQIQNYGFFVHFTYSISHLLIKLITGYLALICSECSTFKSDNVLYIIHRFLWSSDKKSCSRVKGHSITAVTINLFSVLFSLDRKLVLCDCSSYYNPLIWAGTQDYLQKKSGKGPTAKKNLRYSIYKIASFTSELWSTVGLIN